MRKIVIPLGSTFGRLTVVGQSDPTPSREVRWLCKCECGAMATVSGSSLRLGRVLSCGCLRRENPKRIKHGHSKGRVRTREHSTWHNMLTRCYNHNHKQFKYWGGRGITVCNRWRFSFECFIQDMGPCPAGYSIERIDNDGNYEPGNCHWIPKIRQSTNQRSNVILTAPDGSTGCLSEMARKFGLAPSCVRSRLSRGLTGESLFQPSRK